MKIRKKFFISISLSIIVIFLIFMGINSFFLERYYLYTKKNQLDIVKEDYRKESSKEQIEKKYNVVIIETNFEKKLDFFNDKIRVELEKKKIKLNKLWFTENDLKKLSEKKTINKLYNQGLMQSSFLLTVFLNGERLVFIGTAVPHLSESIEIMNRFIFIIMFFGLVLLILVIWILIKNILSPLEKLTRFTEKISHLNFSPIEIKTGDEIEDLSSSINEMSDNLKKAYTSLDSKNSDLKIFMSDITHELKTPLSLIKSYSIGIKDGLDDGTFLDEVLKQNENMENLLDKLLEFSKIQRETLKKEKFSLDELIKEILTEFNFELKKMELNTESIEESYIYADKEKIKRVLINLVSNGIKYSSDKTLEIKLVGDLFSIKNGIETPYDNTEKLWEPFFVGELSRDKKLSGTGLGLSIVGDILKMHEYPYRIEQDDKKIIFFVDFKSSPILL